MKENSYIQLENNTGFKKKYLPEYFWIKNTGLYPPVALLFISLLGLVYLLNYDRLISYYAIPFILMFLLGTIWFKSIRKYILKDFLAQAGSFVVCLGNVIQESEGWVYLVYTTSRKRHNKHYIQSVSKELAEESFIESDYFVNNKELARKVNMPIETDTISIEDNVYVRGFKISDADKSDGSWKVSLLLPLLYIDDSSVYIIRKKDINSL